MSSPSQHPKMLHFAQALAQLGLLFMIWLIGTAIQKWLQLPISGGVIGLLLLLAALLLGVFKLQWIKRGTDLI
ncbi:CidA/LrgA family protein, partial [Acinetobacter sp.]